MGIYHAAYTLSTRSMQYAIELNTMPLVLVSHRQTLTVKRPNRGATAYTTLDSVREETSTTLG
jgi:hypothetical protein